MGILGSEILKLFSRNTDFPKALLPGVLAWSKIVGVECSFKNRKLYFNNKKVDASKIIIGRKYIEELADKKITDDMIDNAIF
jgi:hypothetical protein